MLRLVNIKLLLTFTHRFISTVCRSYIQSHYVAYLTLIQSIYTFNYPFFKYKLLSVYVQRWLYIVNCMLIQKFYSFYGFYLHLNFFLSVCRRTRLVNIFHHTHCKKTYCFITYTGTNYPFTFNPNIFGTIAPIKYRQKAMN